MRLYDDVMMKKTKIAIHFYICPCQAYGAFTQSKKHKIMKATLNNFFGIKSFLNNLKLKHLLSPCSGNWTKSEPESGSFSFCSFTWKRNVFRTGTLVLTKVIHMGKHNAQPGHEEKLLRPIEQNCQLSSFAFLTHF